VTRGWSGSVYFHNGLELRVFEFLDLADGELLDYSYTVFRGEDRIRWYDPQPHPELPERAATFPHHRLPHPAAPACCAIDLIPSRTTS
jgi:hypothetical protein